MAAGPDITQVNRLAILIITKRFSRDIDIQVTGDCISNNQWWLSQVIHLDVGVDTAFKISVSGKHRAGDKVIAPNGITDCFG